MQVPRGNYLLDLSGTGDDHEGDIDIRKNIIVIDTDLLLRLAA